MEKRIIFWVDDRNEVGQIACNLMQSSGLDYLQIPMDRGLPFATLGRSTFSGIEELKIMVAHCTSKG